MNTPEKTSDDVILVTTYEPSQDILRNITKENWDYLGKKSHDHLYPPEKNNGWIKETKKPPGPVGESRMQTTTLAL